MVEINEKGEEMKEQAKDIPQKVAGCVKLEGEEAMELYNLLYKVLGMLQG